MQKLVARYTFGDNIRRDVGGSLMREGVGIQRFVCRTTWLMRDVVVGDEYNGALGQGATQRLLFAYEREFLSSFCS